MNGRLWSRGTALVGLGLAVLTLASVTIAAQTSEHYRGQPLAEVLRALQAKGLRIVFTSATVTADLRVPTEPRARTPRQQLDELLAPHGLEAREGPGGVIQIVRAAPAPDEPLTGTVKGVVLDALSRSPIEEAVVTMAGSDVRSDGAGRFVIRAVSPGTHAVQASIGGYLAATRAVRVAPGVIVAVTLRLTPVSPPSHSEHVTVSRPRPYWHERGAAAEARLQRDDFSWSGAGGMTDDPLRAIHALPRVSVADDLRSDFTVRGSPFRHVGLVVDGVSTPWFQHTAMGRGTTGSLSMLTSEIVEDATLRVGAYPRRFGDRLGAELEISIREGTRERFAFQGSIGGTSGTIVAEGPLGRSAGGARGSWLAATRHSYLEWPVARTGSTRTPFGFADALLKTVYDAGPNQTVGVSLLAGSSNVDGEDLLGAGELADGVNRTGVVNAFWRSTFSVPMVLTQRAYVVKHRFANRKTSGEASSAGDDEAVGYRADLARPLFGGRLEAGAHIARSASASAGERETPGGGAAVSSWERSGYVHGAWTIVRPLTISPGLRVTSSTALSDPAMARWILAEYIVGPQWRLNASIGAFRQLPEAARPTWDRSAQLRTPERSAQVDVSIEQRISPEVRWQATVYKRREADVLREPDLHPRIGDGPMVSPVTSDPPNRLAGSSRGVELLLNRAAAHGFSGWAAYSFGAARYSDADRGGSFWADFDRRHAFTAAWTYSLSTRTSVGAIFRAGSGFPIPAYLREDNGVLVVSDRPNEVRLPPYVRLDLRVSRTFEALGRRVTMVVDVANALNRRNLAAARGAIDPTTGVASGFTDTLQPRRVSAGLVVRF